MCVLVLLWGVDYLQCGYIKGVLFQEVQNLVRVDFDCVLQ